MIPVDLQLDGQFPDGPGLDGLDKAGVSPQLQRRQTKELRPHPESLSPVHRQKLKIRVCDRLQAMLRHQLGKQGRKALQDRPVHRRRQQVIFVLRSPRGGSHGLHGFFQLCRRRGKDHPAVARLCHSKMFEFHLSFPPLSGRCRPSAPAIRCPARCTALPHPERTYRPRRTSRRGRPGHNKG